MSNSWNDAGGPTAGGKRRDPRPSSVMSQDAAILEYAARNRLLRGRGIPAETSEDAWPSEAFPGGRIRRPTRGGNARGAARAEGIYRLIAPREQKYPLKAVTLIRRLLREGAPEEFVLEKYRLHAWTCDDLGVPPMPFIPYLTELLEVFLLDVKLARRCEGGRERSMR